MDYHSVLNNMDLFKDISNSKKMNESINSDIDESVKYFSNKNNIDIFNFVSNKAFRLNEISIDVTSEKIKTEYSLYHRKCIELRRHGYYRESHCAFSYFFIKEEIMRGDFVHSWFKSLMCLKLVVSAFTINYYFMAIYMKKFGLSKNGFSENIEKIVFLVKETIRGNSTITFDKAIKLWSGNDKCDVYLDLDYIKDVAKGMKSNGMSIEDYTFRFQDEDSWRSFYNN